MFKDFFKGEKDKLRLWALLLAITFGLFLLVGGNPFDNQSTGRQEPPEQARISYQEEDVEYINAASTQPSMVNEEKYLADKLRTMLEMVEGAGRVEVTVRLVSSSRAEYAVNTTTSTKTTQEQDQAGGTRVLTEDNDSGQLVLIRSGNGTEIPVLQQERASNISGVLVVAEGAGDPAIKAQLFRAAQVGLGVEPQKILVLAKSK
ncbi:hypothetical protein [Desulfofalx alkaliphila]|uniref:hypothetical protein n=1 Tax=Desulfofalx alkaliphila TaxID=105483 RepID=UPI00054D3B6C|nr:hypothetical protein [Desulfofalx alkaliphila]